MRIPFPYDVGGIYGRVMQSALNHAVSCQEEIVRLRAELFRSEAEVERLKSIDRIGPGPHFRPVPAMEQPQRNGMNDGRNAGFRETDRRRDRA